MGRFAENTRTPVVNSMCEIERIFARYEVSDYRFTNSSDAIGVEFFYKKFPIRLALPLPRSKGKALEKEKRRLWRVLVLSLKSKLELTSEPDIRVQDEFLAYIGSGDQTVGRVIEPQIESLLKNGGPMKFNLLPAKTGD